MQVNLSDNIIHAAERVIAQSCQKHGNHMFYVYCNNFLGIVQYAGNVATVADYLANVLHVYNSILRTPDKYTTLKLYIANLVYEKFQYIGTMDIIKGKEIRLLPQHFYVPLDGDFFPTLSGFVQKMDKDRLLAMLKSLQDMDTWTEPSLSNLMLNFLLHVPETPPHSYFIWLKYGGNKKKCNTIWKENGKYVININNFYKNSSLSEKWTFTLDDEKLVDFLDRYFDGKKVNRRLFPSKANIGSMHVYEMFRKILWEKTGISIQYYDVKFMKEITTKFDKDFRKLSFSDRERRIWDLYRIRCYKS